MYCAHCGSQIADDAIVCVHCGRSTGKPVPVSVQKSRGVYIILGLFFGLLGIHNFYAGYNGRAIAQLLITVFTFWLIAPLVIVGIWVLVEIITVNKDARGNPMG